MLRRFAVNVMLAVAILLILVLPARAGGWAATTLDELPRDVRVGEPITIGFVVRRHALQPMSGLEPVVTAASGEHRLQVEVTEDREAHYVATLMFPAAGTWEWGIDAFGMTNEMPSLEVAPPQTRFEQLLARLLAWLGDPEPARASTDGAAISSAEYGRALFIAKGCKYCHMRAGISNMVPGPVIGPNLTNYQGEPAFLRAWLRDPQAVRPRTQMPDLGLSEAEIEVLIAFLNAADAVDTTAY